MALRAKPGTAVRGLAHYLGIDSGPGSSDEKKVYLSLVELEKMGAAKRTRGGHSSRAPDIWWPTEVDPEPAYASSREVIERLAAKLGDGEEVSITRSDGRFVVERFIRGKPDPVSGESIDLTEAIGDSMSWERARG